jgi:putative inorganic carbon (HCO3(-)) transporter
MRDYLLLIFVIGLVPFILWRAWIGALSWTWIGLMNPHLYAWTLNSFPFAQVIGIAFLIAWVLARDKKMIPITPGVVGVIVLLVFLVVKTPFAWNQDVTWGYLNQYVKVVVAALLISTLIYSPKRVRWLLWTIMISLGLAYGVKGGLFALASAGEQQVQGPEPSFIGGNTHLGVALIMVVPMFIAFIRDTPSAWWRRGAVAGFWLTLMAIVFTYSRGALIGLGAIAVPMFLQSKRKILIAIALIPIALAGIAFTPQKLIDRADTIAEYEEDLSALQRIQGWGVAINVAMRHPLGAGFILDATPVDKWMSYANFTHPAFNRANAAHSIYFQMLGDHGFLGLALFLFINVATFVTLWRVRRLVAKVPDRRWLGDYATAMQIGLIGYLSAGAFVSLAYFDLFYYYVVLAAIMLREAMAPATESKALATVEPRRASGVLARAGGRAENPTQVSTRRTDAPPAVDRPL